MKVLLLGNFIVTKCLQHFVSYTSIKGANVLLLDIHFFVLHLSNGIGLLDQPSATERPPRNAYVLKLFVSTNCSSSTNRSAFFDHHLTHYLRTSISQPRFFRFFSFGIRKRWRLSHYRALQPDTWTSKESEFCLRTGHFCILQATHIFTNLYRCLHHDKNNLNVFIQYL